MRILPAIRARLRRYRQQRTRTNTVRFMFPALLSGAAVLGMLALTATQSESFIYFDVPNQAVEVGELVPVKIFATAAVPINAVELTVSFPAEKADVFGVDRGQSVITIWTEDPVVQRDSVLLRGGTFKRGFLGTHQIATINLRAKQTGPYTVTLKDVRLIAGDGSGTVVPAATVPAATLALYNFDENTSEEEIRVAITSRIKTDLNGDGNLTLQDISAFMGAWSNRTAIYDFNGDGRMTFRDFSIILAEYFFQ